MLRPDPVTAKESADAIRRTILGLALDEGVTAIEAEHQLLWLFRRLVPTVSC